MLLTTRAPLYTNTNTMDNYSIENNEVEGQALRYLNRVHNSSPPKQRLTSENQSKAPDRSRSPNNYKDVSTKDPVNSGDGEANPAAKQ